MLGELYKEKTTMFKALVSNCSRLSSLYGDLAESDLSVRNFARIEEGSRIFFFFAANLTEPIRAISRYTHRAKSNHPSTCRRLLCARTPFWARNSRRSRNVFRRTYARAPVTTGAQTTSQQTDRRTDRRAGASCVRIFRSLTWPHAADDAAVSLLKRLYE